MIPGTQKTVNHEYCQHVFTTCYFLDTVLGIFTAIQKGSEGYSHFADEKIEI